jgi:hypothetical protein
MKFKNITCLAGMAPLVITVTSTFYLCLLVCMADFLLDSRMQHDIAEGLKATVHQEIAAIQSLKSGVRIDGPATRGKEQVKVKSLICIVEDVLAHPSLCACPLTSVSIGSLVATCERIKNS